MMLLGVDIGGTKIAAGIVDGNTGRVLFSERTPTNAHEGGAVVLARSLDLARRVFESGKVAIDAVGIGAGGQIDYRSGVVLSATDILPGWAGTRLAEAFAQEFGVPAFADNDVNAFAQGESRFGAGRTSSAGVGTAEAVYLALGTGVGGAIFSGGKLHRGKRGTGGELGHLTICGEATLEARTSGARLAALYNEERKRQPVPRNRGRNDLPEPVTGLAVGEAARRNPHSDAGEAVRLLGCDLGFGLTSLANILDTERIIIGGGLSDLGELLLAPARETFAEHVLPLYADTEIVAARLGKNSSVIGAACVALAAFEERKPVA